MKIYQQAGHNTNWNIESFTDDSVGSGIIFSPVHYAKDKIEKVDSELKKVSLFDPQFYIPDSQKVKLHSYEFFPEVTAGGFSTIDFEAVAHKSAEQCLEFQIENDFEAIVIPARYYSDLVTDYIENQKKFSVEPFLSEIERIGLKKDIFISLPVTSQMTLDKGYRTDILNWITSYPQISGVYFLNQFSESTKQVTKYENLSAHIEFISDLKGAGLGVIVGYCNTESLLLSALDPVAVTIGAYENTRAFSIDKFLQEESNKRGPAPRVYMPKLLNWVRYDTVIEIKEDFPELWDNIYEATDYMENIFLGGRPHFTKPELYKHHFKLIGDQLMQLSNLNVQDRISELEDWVNRANSLYEDIKNKGVIFFDENCDRGHLPGWNRALRLIKSK